MAAWHSDMIKRTKETTKLVQFKSIQSSSNSTIAHLPPIQSQSNSQHLNKCYTNGNRNKNFDLGIITSLNPRKASRRTQETWLSPLPPIGNSMNMLMNTTKGGGFRMNDNNPKPQKMKQEFEKIENIKLRGTLAPRYTVLPPITNERENIPSSYTQAVEKTSNGENNERKANDNFNNYLCCPIIDKNNYIYAIPHIGGILVLDDDTDKVTSVPKTPDTLLCSKAVTSKLDQKYLVNMIKWMRFCGRRNAICSEIDEIYRELSTIIKHNLLVQQLEEVWMC